MSRGPWRPAAAVRVFVLSAVLLSLGFSTGASAAPVEIDLPDGFTRPAGIAVDAKGNVWATLDGSWAWLRFDPGTNETSKFDLASPRVSEGDSLYGIAFGADGTVWSASQDKLHRLDPDQGEAEAYALPAETLLSGDVHVDEEGGVWVALVTTDVLVRFDPKDASFDQVAVPAGFGPLEFAAGGPGTVFVSGTYGDTLLLFDTTSRTYEMGPASLVESPTGIAYDGRDVWLGEHGGSTVVRVDPGDGSHEVFPTAPSPYYPIAGPSGMVVTSDGAVWSAIHFADRIARIDPEGLTMVEREVPSAPGTNMQRIALGGDDRVWFAEWSGNRLGHARWDGQDPAFDVPGEVRVAPGGSVRFATGATGEVVVGTPGPGIEAVWADGQVELTAADDLPVGRHLVLVSEVHDGAYLGSYVPVLVESTEDAPAPGFMAVVVALTFVMVAARPRHRGGDR